MTKLAVNDFLSDVRKCLEERISGIGTINAVSEPEPGQTVSEETDELDDFMAECARYISRETGLEEDEALEFCFALAEAGQESQLLPAFPGTDAPPKDVADWLNAADETGFVVQAVTQVKEQLGS